MSPDQISALTTLLAVLKAMSTWPLGVLLFMVIVGPWVMSIFLAYSARKRFEAVVLMYESNVRLVEKYDKVAGDLKDVIIMNTQTMTVLGETIKNVRMIS